MDLDALLAVEAELERKLAARRTMPGFAENVRDIEAALIQTRDEIARLRALAPEEAEPQPPQG